MRDILKKPSILILLTAVVLSIILIGPNPNPVGVKIDYISKNSSVSGLVVGDIIYKIDNNQATTALLNKNYSGNVKFDTSKGVKYVNVNGTVGISVEDASFSNLVFGLDIRGGVRALVAVNITDNSTMDRMISTLQTRINLYGLRESNLMPIWYGKQGFIEITMAGGTEEELKDLLEHQGNFEAKIPIVLNLNDNKSSIVLDKKYEIIAENGVIKIGGITAVSGENFTLAGIPFFVNNITDTINLTSTVYSGNDIAIVYFGKSMVEKSGDGYSWSFPLEISADGAKKFAWVTQNAAIAPAKPGETYRYLESKIYLYLDNDLLDELNIRSGLKGKIETSISIEGGTKTVEQAKNVMVRLQSILKSGALPTSIEIVQLDTVSPKLGAGFLSVVAMAAIGAILAVSGVILLRYRKLKLVFPTILISLCEVLIILGVAALIKWNIDLAAIAGIIATVGTGIDSQIIMLDQALRGETKSWTLRERISRAFFVIFGSGGTVLAAMLPMMIIGFGLLRGFAIVTMIGVLAGILITRPAFGVIVEKLVAE
ncbi:MAG: hypothetical protein NT129_01085 [Candidatus Aenigmarchaeota archaeon]|nr:hypothetical protein [Candidatus Aenigmarchaeota archaeon]